MATVEYDDILLNINSRLQNKAFDNAISKLETMQKSLSEITSLDFNKTAQNMASFSKSIKAVPKTTVDSYKQLAKSMATISSKAGKAMKAVAATSEKFQPQSMEELEEIARNALSKQSPFFNPELEYKIQYGEETDWNGEIASATEGAKELRESMSDLKTDTNDAYNQLKAYLELYPKTKDSYLKKYMDFDDETIAHVRQDLYMAAEDAKRMGDGIKETGKEAEKALSPLDKLVNKFKNFLQYRAMRAVWQAFINGAKEGIKNLEDWDRATGMTGFAESMDRARESLLVLKNSLAVITAPALEFLIGVLQKIATWAMTAANAISRFFAILGGKSSYRAVIWADTIADSTSKASGSAKKATDEFKKQLMAFDEINNITAQNESGSGGGGGSGSGASYTEMFEERDVGELGKWEQLLSNIGEAWRQMSEKIRTATDSTSRHLQSIKDVWEGWKKFFQDNDTWQTEWGSKLNIAIETFKTNLHNAFSHISTAWDKLIHGDIKGAFAEIDLMLEDTTTQGETAVKMYGAAWAEENGYIRRDVDDTRKFIDTQTGRTLDTFLQGTTVAENGFSSAKGKINEDAKNAGATVKSTVTTAVNDLQTALNNTFGRNYYLRTVWDEIINRTVHVNEVYTAIQGKGYTSNYKFASGGYPTTGQMFIAREAGPELVGTIGGQTAVVNNQDIVASVSQGVASAVASVLGGGTNVSVTLEGDAKNLFKVVQREGRAYSARTGQPSMA